MPDVEGRGDRRALSVYMPPGVADALDAYVRKFIYEHARVSVSEVVQRAIALAVNEHSAELERRLLDGAARARGRGQQAAAAGACGGIRRLWDRVALPGHGAAKCSALSACDRRRSTP